VEFRKINEDITVSPQITRDDVAGIAAAGYRAIICNRPDGEGADQQSFEEIEAAAKQHGLEARYMPVVSGKVEDSSADEFGRALRTLPGPVFAYCRTGTRSATLWSLSQAKTMQPAEILMAARNAGYDMAGVVRRIVNGGKTPTDTGDARFDVVVVGGGAAGIAVSASLKARKPDLSIAVLDPSDVHYYQPGWTMVGGGIFEAGTTARTMGSLIPKGVHWIKSAVAAFEPQNNAVILDGCRVVKYDRLIVCPGLKLDWTRVKGLVDTLGKNAKAYTLFHLGGSYRATENLTLNATIYNLFDKDFVDGKAYTTYSSPRYNNTGVLITPGGAPGDPAYGTDYSHSGAATTGIVEEGRRLWLSANLTF